ncbi:MAG: hypothetical protein ABIJ42_04920, partial [Acidobacteriota bacterium]
HHLPGLVKPVDTWYHNAVVSSPHFSPNNYCGGVYIHPDCVMLLRPAVRSLLAKDGLLDVLYKYDCGVFISGRMPCQAGVSTASLRNLVRNAGWNSI